MTKHHPGTPDGQQAAAVHGLRESAPREFKKAQERCNQNSRAFFISGGAPHPRPRKGRSWAGISISSVTQKAVDEVHSLNVYYKARIARLQMKPSSIILVLCHCLLTGCDAQVSEQARQKKWLEEDSKVRKASMDRDKEIADFRSDLKMPWSELVLSLRYDCSCTGTHYTGFCIAKDNDSITVAPWIEVAGIQRKGVSRPLTKNELEKLISEAALFYLAASLSVSPLEKVGPPPKDTSKFAAWRAGYLSAGGSPEGSDHLWVEARVISKNGVKTHHNMWEREAPADFSNWIGAFGILPIH